MTRCRRDITLVIMSIVVALSVAFGVWQFVRATWTHVWLAQILERVQLFSG